MRRAPRTARSVPTLREELCFGCAHVAREVMSDRVVTRCALIAVVICTTIARGQVVTTPRILAQNNWGSTLAQGAMPQTADKQPSTAEPAPPTVPANTAPAVDARDINLDGRPIRGAKDAKVTIVFFDDFQCPYSAAMYKKLFDVVLKDYPDRVKVALRDTPNPEIHLWAKHAAIDANCLAAQNGDAYWDFSDYVHTHQAEITKDAAGVLDKLALEQGQKHNLDLSSLRECIQAQSETVLKESRSEAIHHLGVRANPTLLINGEKLVGVRPAQQLREAIDRSLRAAGESAPMQPAPTEKPPAANRQPQPGAAGAMEAPKQASSEVMRLTGH